MEKHLLRKFQSGRSPEPDKIQGFWLKKTKLVHGTASQRKNRLNEGQLPEWMSQGGTDLNNDLYKRKSAEKYCPALFGSCSQRYQSPDKQRGYRGTLRRKERTNHALP